MFTLKATTISDAWFRAIYNLPEHGYKQIIQSGSFEGEYRLQYPSIAIEIEHPDKDIVPVFPVGLKIPHPVEKGMETNRRKDNADLTRTEINLCIKTDRA